MIVNEPENKRTIDTETGDYLTCTENRIGRDNFIVFKLFRSSGEVINITCSIFVEKKLDEHTYIYKNFIITKTPNFEISDDYLYYMELIDNFLSTYKFEYGADDWAPRYKNTNTSLICEIDHSGGDRVFVEGEGYVNV